MQKTVNQWLDWLDCLPDDIKKSVDVKTFRNKLCQIKYDERYNGFGGTLNLQLPEYLNELLDKT